jgi:hypothetical protein
LVSSLENEFWIRTVYQASPKEEAVDETFLGLDLHVVVRLQGSLLLRGSKRKARSFLRKRRSRTDYVFRMSVGNEVLEFPLNAQNKAPSYDWE